jgi:hypothetical protein
VARPVRELLQISHAASPPAALASGKIASVPDQAALSADVLRYFAELSATQLTLVIFADLLL